MRSSGLISAGRVGICWADSRRRPFHRLVRTLVITVTMLLAVSPAIVVAENQSQPAQGPADEGLKERVKSLERTVEELTKERGSPKVGESNVKREEGYQGPTPGTSTEVPAHERERGMLRQDNYADPRIDNAPFDPQLRGFFRLPGTETMLRLGGFARTDVIHDFSPAGNTSKFVTSSIPTGPNPGSDNTSMSVAPSRISVELRNNTQYGPLRIYYENDFNNGPNTTNSFRLRHFYGQWQNVLVGQTWSAWGDTDAIPDTVDFEGPNSWIFRLQPQVRYTYAMNKENIVAASVEQPKTEMPGTVTAGTTTTPINPNSPIPDFVVRYRHEQSRFHIQNAWLFRDLGGFVTPGTEKHVFGWGGMLSAAATVYKKDNIMVQGIIGEGIARYINDLGEGTGLDVGVKPDGTIVALPAWGMFGSYQHFWAERWRSSFTYGYLHVSTTDIASPTLTNNSNSNFTSTQYSEANLMYSPGAGFTLGAGLLWGQHVVKNGDRGDDIRLNFVLQYDLVNLGNW
jgi:outer membrane DcaP-like protein